MRVSERNSESGLVIVIFSDRTARYNCSRANRVGV